MYFPTTHWSLLANASLDGETEAHSALGELCRRYWAPLKQFIRSRGYAETEAEDLTQEFLLHLLTHSTLRKPDPLRGKFRSFLLGALMNFLSHDRERRAAQKRGGLQPHVNVETFEAQQGLVDATVSQIEMGAFDRMWALTVVRAALEAVAKHYIQADKGELFAVLRAFLPGENPPPPYEQAAAQAGLSVTAFNSEVHRLRGRFRDQVRAEVTSTVSAPHEIDEEITYLYGVLMDRGTNLWSRSES